MLFIFFLVTISASLCFTYSFTLFAATVRQHVGHHKKLRKSFKWSESKDTFLFSLKLHIAVFCKLLHTNFPPLPLSDLPKVIPEKRLWTFPNRLNRPTCESLYVVSQQPSVSDRFISGGRKTNCLQKPISEWTHRGGNLPSCVYCQSEGHSLAHWPISRTSTWA